MKKFSLVSIFLITKIVALSIAYFSSQTRLSATRAELTKLRNDYKVLNPSRPELIRSIAIPAFKRNQWQWKIDLPDSNRYVLRIAYDDIPAQGIPTSVLPLVSPTLPSEEFLLTATVLNENGRWKINWRTETLSRTDEMDVTVPMSGSDHTWLLKQIDHRAEFAGRNETTWGSPEISQVLLRHRKTLPNISEGSYLNPNPTDGLLLWIEPVPNYDSEMLAKHVVLIHAESIPPGLNKVFPAIVFESNNGQSILVSCAWGAEPFPMPPNGKPLDSLHLLNSSEAVKVQAYDEALGVAVFSVNVPLQPWPNSLIADGVSLGEDLKELFLQDPGSVKRLHSDRLQVSAIDKILRYNTARGSKVEIEGTLIFEGQTACGPGAVFIREGKLAAIFLNNESVGDQLVSHALPANLLVERYRALLDTLNSMQH